MQIKTRTLTRRKQAGIRNRLGAHAQCVALPSILVANVHSLEKQLDDLRTRVNFQRDNQECNILYFPDEAAVPDQDPAVFSSLYDQNSTGKLRGDRVCLKVGDLDVLTITKSMQLTSGRHRHRHGLR